MSVSGISSSSLTQLLGTDGSNSMSQMQQAWKQLGQDLQSGNLSGAQSAFQTIQQLQSQATGSSGSKSQGSSQLSSDMQALGQALSAGNLSAAQSAFSAVKSDMKSMHHHHHSQAASASSQSTNSQADDIVELLGSSTNSTGNSSSTTSDNQTATGANVSVLA